jgi:RND superfamily putative drug exporter
MLSSLATFLHSHRRRVLIVAVAGAVIAGAFGAGVADRLSPYGTDDPASQSVQATSRFETATGRQIEPGIVALVSAGDIRRSVTKTRVEQVAAKLGAQPDVASVATFYTTHNAAMVARDGRSTYVLAYFRALSDKRLSDDAKLIETRFSAQPGVRLGGDAIANAQVNTQVGNDLAHAELLAFPVIFLLSLLFFRSLVAALLPPLLGGLAIVGTFFLLRLVSTVTDLNVFALNLTTGLGLGLAIDYSLFIVSRYREEAARDGFGVEALRRTLQTAGRTVLFSSATVAVAVAALTIFPQRFLYSMGIAGAIVALLAGTLALIVLPALLALLGPRVNAISPRRLRHAAERDARPAHSGAWYRLAQFVTRRPAPVAVATAAALIALGIPFAQIRFITADARVLPQSASAHQVQSALDSQFPPNRTTPLEVVVGLPASSPQVRALTDRIARLPDVSAVAPAQPAGREASLLQVAPARGPLTDRTKQLVRNVRAFRAPYYLGVAGQTASYLDLEGSLGAHLPAALAVVVAATIVVLFLMTGSLLLPLKAVAMNALNLSAVFGILVLIFQHGNLEGLLGYRSLNALDATQPILLFAIGFGLATDYGVFLLARIKEAHDGGAANTEAVALGLERTGRIVTAAAVLFSVAVGAFATSQIVFIKELGIGTALTVLLDASLIRALLVPSLMGLLGPLNWWAPRPLRRLHDRFGLREGFTSQIIDTPPLGLDPPSSY